MLFENVRSGTYRFTAQDEGSLSYGPDNVTVQQCGCLSVELQ